MKHLNSIALLALCVLVGVLLFRSCDSSTGDGSERVDSIKTVIEKRDSLIVSRDTVIYKVKEVRNLVTEYRIETDTILKIQICDSLAITCDSLAVQYNRQDSIFREQIGSYVALVAVQDSIIKAKPKRKWIIIPVPIPFRRR